MASTTARKPPRRRVVDSEIYRGTRTVELECGHTYECEWWVLLGKTADCKKCFLEGKTRATRHHPQ